jgi:hypothetical protein
MADEAQPWPIVRQYDNFGPLRATLARKNQAHPTVGLEAQRCAKLFCLVNQAQGRPTVTHHEQPDTSSALA